MTIYLSTAKKQIEKGNVSIDVIRYNLHRHFLAKDKAVFNQQLKAEYELLLSENTDFVTFDEYKNEQVEVSPAVDATYDADGFELTPYQPAVFEAVRPFVPQDNYNVEIDAFLASSPVYAEAAKRAKYDAIKSLTVTVDGMIFDADPAGRQNMADAILASPPTGITSTQWKLADNTIATVTLAQLTQAHALAIQAVGSVVVGV